MTEITDLLNINLEIGLKDVVVYHEGDCGEIKRVTSKLFKRKNVRLNYYGPLLDLDLIYKLKNID